MTILLDYSADRFIWDNPESLSYYSRTSEGPVTYSASAITLISSVREVEANTEQGPGGAMLNRRTTAFHVSQVELGVTLPKDGDKITDPEGVSFIVQDGGEYERTLTRMWRLPVQQEI